jgi:tetratricopeptide (TPR) repeat protein
MEKDKLLDIAHKETVISEQCIVNSLKIKKLYLLVLLATIYWLLTTGCSLPRIIVLDDPLTPEEHINLGVAYEKKGELDLAVREYEIASKKLPAAYLYLGNVHMQMNKTEEAERYYKKAIKKQPDLADAYNNLAWLYYNKARCSGLKAEDIKEILKEAENLALKAMELNSSNENYKDTLDKIRELESGKH